MQRDPHLPPAILEALKPLRVLARSWPGKPDGIDPSAVFRFRNKGSGGVRLRASKVPGVGWCSCWAWVAEFIAATGGPAAAPQEERPRRRRGFLRNRLCDAVKQSIKEPRPRPSNERGEQ